MKKIVIIDLVNSEYITADVVDRLQTWLGKDYFIVFAELNNGKTIDVVDVESEITSDDEFYGPGNFDHLKKELKK